MPESDFIKKLREGNLQAYNLLLTTYQQKVFHTCLSFVPNKEEAEDLAQEVFIEVFKSISKFKENSSLSTWIYKISTNKCLAFIRKKNTKKRFAILQVITGNEMALDKGNYFTTFNHPGVKLENKEKSELLFVAINKLPKDQKMVFTLHKIDGLSYKEIIEITGKSKSSIESLLFRAKKKLKELLKGYYKSQKE